MLKMRMEDGIMIWPWPNLQQNFNSKVFLLAATFFIVTFSSFWAEVSLAFRALLQDKKTIKDCQEKDENQSQTMTKNMTKRTRKIQ